MAEIQVSGGRLTVRLRRWQKVAGLIGDLDGTHALEGVRAPGLAWPGGPSIGTWRGQGATRWVAVRPGHPALRLRLRGERYDEVLVATPDGEALAAAISARTP
jgi:hypothetical protein